MICWLDLDSNLEGTYIYIIKSACIAKTLQTALLPSNEDGPWLLVDELVTQVVGCI